MSSRLDKARQQVSVGKYKAALDSLRLAAPTALAGDVDLAREILQLVTEIAAAGGRRVLGDCRDLADSMQGLIERESGMAAPKLPQCEERLPKGIIRCASCGKKASEEWAVCPECGANPATGHSDAAADTDHVEFLRAVYLGGLPWAQKQLRGRLVFTREGITLEPPPSIDPGIRMEQVRRVELMSSERATVRMSSAGATAGWVVGAAFLPLLIGAPLLIDMAVGDRINRLALAVHLEDESDALCAYFRVDDVYPNLFMDRLGPLLNSVQVPLGLATE